MLRKIMSFKICKTIMLQFKIRKFNFAQLTLFSIKKIIKRWFIQGVLQKRRNFPELLLTIGF